MPLSSAGTARLRSSLKFKLHNIAAHSTQSARTHGATQRYISMREVRAKRLP